MKYFYINLKDMAFTAMPMISFEHILQIDFNIRLSMVTQSALNAVTCGVPQGSVLGPLFFCPVCR